MDDFTITFWGLVLLLLVYVPLVLIWAATLIDIFRRDDMGGVRKAVWLVAIVVLPLLGTLLYLLLRRPAEVTASTDPRSAEERLRELVVLASLRDRGTIDDTVFATESRRLLGTQPGVPVPSQPTAASAPSRS